jgi:amino acid adenylation domain-containing protein
MLVNEMVEYLNLTPQEKEILNLENATASTINNICFEIVVPKILCSPKRMSKIIKRIINKRSEIWLKIAYDDSNIAKKYYEKDNDYPIEIATFLNPNDKNKCDDFVKSQCNTPLFKIRERLFKVSIIEHRKTISVLWVIHHLLADGISVKILGYQLVANVLRLNFLNHTLSPIKEAQSTEEDNNFYQQQVFGFEPKRTLINVSSHKTSHSSNITLDFPKQLTKNIYKVCKQENINLATFISAIIISYKSFATGSSDSLTGFVTHGRSRNEKGKRNYRLGVFSHSLPLITKIKQDINFRDLLRYVKSTIEKDLQHQNMSIDTFLDSNPNLREYLDSSISVQQVSKIPLGFELIWHLPNETSLPLQFHIMRGKKKGKSISIRYLFQQDLISEKQIKTIHRYLQHISETIVKDLSKQFNEIPLFDKMDEVIENARVNNLVKLDSDITNIYQLLEKQVSRTPNAIAIISIQENITLTYSKLGEEIANFEKILINKGVKSGDVVVLKMDRSIKMIVAIYAILKLGAIWVPIDHSASKSYTDFIVQDSKASYCIDYKNKKLDVVKVNTEAVSTIDKEVSHILYTSGTTGQPKGVLLTHLNIINYCLTEHNFTKPILSNNDSLFLALTNYTFDIFGNELYWGLTNGVPMLIMDDDLDFPTIVNYAHKNKVTALSTTVSVLNELINASTNETNFLKNVSTIILIGEPIPNGLFSKIKAISNARIFNDYGPTEATIITTEGELLSDNDINVGKPSPNTSVFIVRKIGNDYFACGTRIIGEVAISGINLAQGYIDSDTTNKKFIHSKTMKNSTAVGRLYLSGDLGYWREDGNLILLNRNDEQVKIKGNRIELGGVTRAVENIEGVDNAFVAITNNELVCLYKTSENLSPNIIRRNLVENLPIYSIPKYLIRVDSFPLNSSGKIDRKYLTENLSDYISVKTSSKMPINELENEILNLLPNLNDENSNEQIGVQDDLFNFGLSSLIATIFAGKLSDRFEIEISPLDIYKNSNISSLAKYISTLKSVNELSGNHKEENLTSQLHKLHPRQYHYLNQYNNSGITRQISFILELDNKINRNNLENSINTIFTNERIFCSKISEKGIQESVDATFQLKSKDFKTVQEMKNFISEVLDFKTSPYDNFQARVFYFTIGKKIYLFTNINHIVFDGFSTPLLANRILNAYEGISEKNNSSYIDLATLQSNLRNEFYNKELSLWQKYLKDYNLVQIPLIKERTVIEYSNKKRISHYLRGKDYENIIKCCNKLQINLETLIASLLISSLANITNQDDITISVWNSGRNLPNSTNTIGLFSDNYPLRQRNILDLSPKDLIYKLFENQKEISQNFHITSDDILNNTKRPAGYELYKAISNIILNFQSLDYQESELFKDVSDKLLPKATSYIGRDLVLQATELKNKKIIFINFEYNDKFIDKSTAKLWSQEFLTLLEKWVSQFNKES